MNAETIRNWLTRHPFVPFEVCMADGVRHPVIDPDDSALFGSRLHARARDGDYEIMCSLLHVVEVRPLQSA